MPTDQTDYNLPQILPKGELISGDQIKLFNLVAQLQDKMAIVQEIQALFFMYEKYIYAIAYNFPITTQGTDMPPQHKKTLDGLERKLEYLVPMIPQLNIERDLQAFFRYFRTGKFRTKKVRFQRCRKTIAKNIQKCIEKINRIPFYKRIELGGAGAYEKLFEFLDLDTKTVKKIREFKEEYEALFEEQSR